MGALVEISEVILARPLPAEIHAGFLDRPKPGALLDAGTVDVFGWAVGAQTEAVAVELCSRGEAVWRAPLAASRPDLSAALPERPEAASAGFRTTIDLIGTPPEFELEVSVVLADQRRAKLATVRGRHRWRRQSAPAFAELASVVITSDGDAEGLAATIESVLAQSYPQLEIVVVGEGGTAAGIASRYPQVRHAGVSGAGTAAARNLGIRCSNGDFLTFLDAGSRLSPDAVEVGLRALEQRPECAAAIPTGSAAAAVYRRSLFEHVRRFDPRLGAAAGLGFDLALVGSFPVAELPPAGGGRGRDGEGSIESLSGRLWQRLTSEAGRSLRERRIREALRQGLLLVHFRAGARRRPVGLRHVESG